MSKFYSDLAGPYIEPLAKAIFRQDQGAVVDGAAEIYLPLLALPRSLMSWVVQNVHPLEVGETKVLDVPGSDCKLEIRKQAPDSYRGQIQKGNKIIHKIEGIPLPAVAGTLLNVCDLYSDVAGREVDSIEKKELAAAAQDSRIVEALERLGTLIDKITERVHNDQVKKEEPKASEPVVQPAPAHVMPPINISVNVTNDNGHKKDEPVAEVKKEEMASLSKDDEITKLKAELERIRAGHREDPIARPDTGNAATRIIGVGPEAEPVSTVSLTDAPPRMPGPSGVSFQGGTLRDHGPVAAKQVARSVFENLKAQKPLPLPKAELEKAREDNKVPADLRAEYRHQRDKVEGHDPLQSEVSAEKGVSYRGIEARRGSTTQNKNPEGVMSHGYARVSAAPKHAARARTIFAHVGKQIKDQPKPDLPKAELEKAAIKAPKAPETGMGMPHMAAQAPTPPVGPSMGAAKKPALNAPKAPVFAPQGPKAPAAPKAGKTMQPPKMASVVSVTKDELEGAKSDTGSRLFTKDEFGKYRFNPTGLHSMFSKSSVEVKKNENGSLQVLADKKEWDQDNLKLLAQMLKLKNAMNKIWNS